jgi:hypothetical protein
MLQDEIALENVDLTDDVVDLRKQILDRIVHMHNTMKLFDMSKRENLHHYADKMGLRRREENEEVNKIQCMEMIKMNNNLNVDAYTKVKM